MITVDDASPVPPFEQIRGQLTDLIRSGRLEDGARLPSIRQLARDLQVATGTVARAYTQLEAAGFIESSRSHGTRVRGDQVIGEDIRSAAAEFIRIARQGSLDLGDALSIVRADWTAS
jgi:GntR family transcriptional regulator